MSKPEDFKADRSRWRTDGPWWDEPDRKDWEHEGFACMAKRHRRSGNWCGYVGVPPGHPWHGKAYGDIDAEVHGSLTYAEECQGDICHTPKAGEPEHLWWLGFDCAHCYDASPVGDEFMAWDATYRTLQYVQHETESLAQQAKEAE